MSQAYSILERSIQRYQAKLESFLQHKRFLENTSTV
jgi:hypothetical protein